MNQILAAVTPEVASQLDANGHFVFAEPTVVDVPLITQGRARELALAYWHTFNESLKLYAEHERKAPIAADLHVCARAYLAESGYDPFAANLPREYRRAWGSAWVVGLCGGSEQQVVIAVSVEATDLTIEPSGNLVGARPGDLYSRGVPPGITVPVEPEYGAVTTASRSHRLVGGVPRLRRGAQHAGAFSAVWTFDLNTPVLVSGTVSGMERSRTQLGLGRWQSGTSVQILDANPDNAADPRTETVSVLLNGDTPTVIEMTRRIDVPTHWEPVIARTP